MRNLSAALGPDAGNRYCYTCTSFGCFVQGPVDKKTVAVRVCWCERQPGREIKPDSSCEHWQALAHLPNGGARPF